MKQNKLIKISLLTLSLFITSSLFVGCSSDEQDVFEEGDPTDLKIELAECYIMLEEATLIDYAQKSIDKFKVKLDAIQSVLDESIVSEQDVKNMTINLNDTKNVFIKSKFVKIPSEALIAGWSFDEGEGSLLVSDGMNQLTANLMSGPSEIFPTTSMPQFVDGIKGKAIYFTNGSHLEIPDYNPADFLGQQLSIAVWVKPDVTKSGNYITSLNYWKNWKLQIEDHGKVLFAVNTARGLSESDNESDMSVPSSKWSHVVVSLDLDAQKLWIFVDGEETKKWEIDKKPELGGSQMSPYLSPLNKQLPLMIGAATTYEEALATWGWSGWNTLSNWSNFDGAMDEIKFYNIALKEEHVQGLYNQELTQGK